MSSPHGPCSDLVNQICDAGTCVVGPCSGTRPDGACTAKVCTDDPAYGCVLTMQSTCCNAALQGASGCAFGSCAVPLCSAAFAVAAVLPLGWLALRRVARADGLGPAVP